MTQYAEVVEQARRQEAVLDWARQVEYILAVNGYIETALNDGSIKRKYHREVDGHKVGDIVIIEEAKSIDELVKDAPIFTFEFTVGV